MATTGPTDRPSTLEKVCYGIGALAYMTTLHVLNFYLSYFLVTVAQVPPLDLLLVGVLGRVAEILAYPVLTYLITRTDTRWGQLKPWILGCTLAAVPFYMLEWYVPDMAPAGKIAYFVVLYITESVLNSGVTLAHRTLVMHISDHSSDRESAIAFRSASGLIGMVVGVGIEGQVVVAFGGSLSGTCIHSNGSLNSTVSNVTSVTPVQTGRQETGYLVAAGIMCLLALIFVTITLTVTERTGSDQGW
ncbi:sodium-dependent lysophosphatidylcholine symporter 1-B-like [Branchiostoma floridae x Branchiostoma japonicum]